MFLGIEIGGTKLQLVTGDSAGRITERCRLSVHTADGAGGIRAQIEEALPQLLGKHAILGAGVGFGGPVNWRTGRIACSHQIKGWSEFDLANWLSKLTGAPVFADNDANVAALGEAWLGAGVGVNPAFYTTLGSGVGGGLVLDGTIYHGETPGESELGHLRLDRIGTTLESRCSGWAVDARIRESNRQYPQSLLSRLCGNTVGGEARHLGAALEQSDAKARRILEETAADLAYGLSHVVHLFHPAVIILGGGLSHVGEPLRVAVQAALAPQVMEVFQPGPPIRLAALGEDAVPVGALRLAAMGCSL